MAAIVTDQFRILNASNFIDSVVNTNNSYYVFLGLSNPTNTSFGRTTTWDTNTPNPTDNLDYSSHYKDTALFGKKITSSNIRRVIRYVKWTANTSYDMYRHDYSISNPAPNSNLSRLYDSNFYVINKDYKVYICIYNGSYGSYGSSSENLKGNKSQDEPTFTDLDPSSAGQSADGYIWKYLFSISPSDIIKFDSTEYIVVPNDWKTSTNSEIVSIRENGYSSSTNPNQIKQVYISNGGEGYNSGIFDILGDGTGGKVSITATGGKITSTQVTAGGYGYTWAIVDLKRVGSIPAKLIPIIPPSKGHGYDIYTELGTDKILIYARFDDSTKDFPTDTKFSQVGIIKNPTITSSDSIIFKENQYSTLSGIAFTSGFSGSPSIGQEITQTLSGQIGTARGYVASYDKETKVLKYFRDRSLYFGNNSDQTDYDKVSSKSKVLSFESSAENIGPFSASIDTSFANNSNKITVGSKVIDLGVTFTGGLSNPEINTKSGEIIYIDNRPLVTRDIRQKEDIKIILEF
jgi:Bacteriophage T4, Gp8